MKNKNNKDTKKEREVYVIGRPSLDNLDKGELKALYSTLLLYIIEYYKNENLNS